MHELHWTDRACICESIVDLDSDDEFENDEASCQVSILIFIDIFDLITTKQ